jgi:DNA (cytosine-5)-methyltransferase 1
MPDGAWRCTVSTCTTGTCPHGRGVFIWLGDGPWQGEAADPDNGRYPWVHDTSVSPGHLHVCDLMPFATPREAREASDDGITLDLFAGPGGWSEAARALGICEVGIEIDAAACATRAAAGHKTIRADVSAFAVTNLPLLRGFVGSPVCITFSAAGKRAGNLLTAILADGIRDAFAGRQTRARRRREAVRVLKASKWGDLKWTRAERSAAAWKAVRSASLMIEPARFIHSGRPEWIALEQVPAVLPLWNVYADELRKMGYSTWTGKLNAADYGVPQTRERAILIASRVRRVSRPEPTHYDPRKGDQLWGTPWVSMADALGWGADERPAVAVTAGGTSTGGAEPFGHRGRGALEAERDAGRWALRAGNQPNAALRPAPAPAPAPAMAFGHNAARMEWVLHTNRDQRPDGSRQTVDPSTAPALTSKSGGQWTLRSGQSIAGAGRAERTAGEPAVTVTGRADLCSWVTERPATTVQGDPRIGRPGHKDREGGESQFAQDSVRITVDEAAVLQSFPPDYSWRGTKTAQFTQVGNAWCPLAAIHVIGMATGIDPREVAGQYGKAVYGHPREAA